MTKGLARWSGNRGFGLVEVALTFAILAVLVAVVALVILPNDQFRDARDAQRKSDVDLILDAVHLYALDHEGQFPQSISNTPKEICKSGIESCLGLLDLSVLVPTYVSQLPVDPLVDEQVNGTGYIVYRSEGQRITVSAPLAEGEEIESTK